MASPDIATRNFPTHELVEPMPLAQYDKDFFGLLRQALANRAERGADYAWDNDHAFRVALPRGWLLRTTVNHGSRIYSAPTGMNSANITTQPGSVYAGDTITAPLIEVYRGAGEVLLLGNTARPEALGITQATLGSLVVCRTALQGLPEGTPIFRPDHYLGSLRS